MCVRKAITGIMVLVSSAHPRVCGMEDFARLRRWMNNVEASHSQ